MRQSIEQVALIHAKSIYCAAYNICKNAEDANDVVQEVLISYHLHSNKQFDSEEHLRAWLLRVGINKAKDLIRAPWHRLRAGFEGYEEEIPFEEPEEQLLYQELMRLPEKYRIVMHLYYYEDLTVREIAEVLGKSESGIKMRLSRGREFLKNILKEEMEG